MTKLDEDVIIRHDGILGDRPTFRGTRCQAELLFENPATGYSIDGIVDALPTPDRDDLRVALLRAMHLLIERAPRVALNESPS